MATKITNEFAQAMMTGTGGCAAMDGAYVRIYSGSAPTNAGDAATGTKLWEDNLAAQAESSMTNNVLTLDHSALSAAGKAEAGGGTVAGYFRVVRASDDKTLIQGTCGTSAADMILDSATIASGATVSVTAWTITVPLA